MIKWRGSFDGAETIGLCLEAANVERLRAGEPIHIRGKDLGIPFDIVIQYGATQEIIIEQLRRAGRLPPEREWKR